MPHPTTPTAAVRSLMVHVERARNALSLRYLLAGHVERLRIPVPRQPVRADGLWRRTCFEAFVAADGAPAYREFNFSPSGEWAAYAFANYREGGSALDCGPPTIHCRRSPGVFELEAEVPFPPGGSLRLGLSAVLEDAEGLRSYWALRHPGARPDFHDPASFTLTLDEVRD
jgi:hypothetical protein